MFIGNIALLVLPGLPSSGYVEEILLQQWEADCFNLISFMAQIGRGIACILCAILLLVTSMLLLHHRDIAANISDPHDFFAATIIILLSHFVGTFNLLVLPSALKLLDIKLDRDIMEKNVEHIEQENRKEESRRRDAQQVAQQCAANGSICIIVGLQTVAAFKIPNYFLLLVWCLSSFRHDSMPCLLVAEYNGMQKIRLVACARSRNKIHVVLLLLH